MSIGGPHEVLPSHAFNLPGVPSVSGLSLAMASVRISKLPSSFTLPVMMVVGALA